MCDFKAGHDIHIEGDVYINDQSHQPISLVQCTNEELYAQRQYRKQRLAREKKRKIKRWAVLFLCGEVVLCGVALWYHMLGNTTLSSLLLGLGSIFLGLVALQYVVVEQNDLQQAHINALREIDLILRERDAQ